MNRQMLLSLFMPEFLGFLYPQVFLDVSRKGIIDFRMPRHRLLLSSSRIAIDIVARPMTVQYTAGSCQLTNELAALHTMISFA